MREMFEITKADVTNDSYVKKTGNSFFKNMTH